MAINDNFHVCAGTSCGCHAITTGAISPFSAWPLPMAFPPPPSRCPATTRHIRRYSVEAYGLQCHYEPGHDGDHAAYAGPGEGDIFWPQEAPSAAEHLPEVPSA